MICADCFQLTIVHCRTWPPSILPPTKPLPWHCPGLGRALVMRRQARPEIRRGNLPQGTDQPVQLHCRIHRLWCGFGFADLAHTMSTAFGAPLLDLEAIDIQRLPRRVFWTPRSASCLPGGRAEQAQQPADRCDSRSLRPAGGRKDQVRHPDGGGLDHRGVRQAVQNGRGQRNDRRRGHGQHHWRRLRV
jgi:hypothetical protein